MKIRKKLVILTEFYPPNISGVSHSVYRIVKGLSQYLEQVCLIAITPYPQDCRSPHYILEEEGNIRIWRVYVAKEQPLIHPESLRACYYLISRIVRQESFDFIHAFCTFNCGYLANLLHKEIGIKYLLSIRGNDLTRAFFMPEKAAALKTLLEDASGITSVNSFLKDFLRAHFSQVVKKITVIYNSILPPSLDNETNLDTALLKETITGKNSFVFSYIGDIKEKKGVFPLIEVFKKFALNRPDARLLIVGEVYSSDYSFFRDTIADIPQIIYKEKVPHKEVFKYYSITDVSIIPSIDDGFPNGLLEGIYTKTPLIASKIFSDILRHGKDALLFDPFLYADLLSCMEELYTNTPKREALRENAFLLLSGILSPENEILSYIKKYDEVWKV